MSLHRRAFLANFAGTTAGVTAGIALASTPGKSPARKNVDPVVIEDSFPAFSLDEYADRLKRVRKEMAAREIDLLFVTQPSSMCYLHGYTCTWYRAASTSGWPPMAGTAIHVDHDRMIHFDFPDEIRQLQMTSIVQDKRIYSGENLSVTTKFLIDELSAEGWIKGSNVGLEFWSFVPPRAVSEAIEAAMRDAGARNVVDGSFVTRKVRRTKSKQEIEYIRQAVDIAELGMRAAEEVARPGVMECEVYGEAMRAMYAAGGEVQGINQGFNVRGLPHTYSGRNRIRHGDLGAFDICGVVNRYHGNVARAFYFREPDKKTQDAFALSADAYEIIRQVARPGSNVATLNAALREHFEPKGAWDNAYYIGGYELGIAFPPDWVGEWMFDAVGGVAPGEFEAGMVTNFESIFFFENEQGEPDGTSNITTIIYGEDETEVLGTLPLQPIVIT